MKLKDRDLLRSVTAHELAIQEFVTKELEGESNHSVEAVLNLLEKPPEKEAY